MKIDLHVHSKYSRRPSEWILKKLGCPESFTDPLKLYAIAKKRGMSLVTITDHNTIDGCLEIADKPDVFISEEVTTYNPDDGCKFHVLVYDIDEAIHRDLQDVRKNLFELIPYLRNNGIVHSLAHPLYSVNGKLNTDHVERSLVLFKNFELNGARGEGQNQRIRAIVNSLNSERLIRMAARHGLEGLLETGNLRTFTGGSDDHSSLTIARCHTQVEGAIIKKDFFHGLEIGKAEIVGHGSRPETLAHNIYSIGYQFYENKLGLSRYVKHDVVFKFLDKFLLPYLSHEPRLMERLNFYWNNRKNRYSEDHDDQKVIHLLKKEAQNLIREEPGLFPDLQNAPDSFTHLDMKWFNFVNRISNNLLKHFSDKIMDSLTVADLINIFQSLGSAGALYSVIAPYFVSYSVFSEDRRFSRDVADHLEVGRRTTRHDTDKLKVAHFTDTFYEVNGVAGTLKKQIMEARLKKRNYTVITCDENGRESSDRVKNFFPIGVYELSVYPEQKLFYPPFLEMVSHCYQREFNQIHAATPGPLGLAALAISRILKVPFVGTYHTALPQYAQHLTEDPSISDIMWRYLVWFYDQMDAIFVPSRATANELIDHGISVSKIRLMPRGVDCGEFHPANRTEGFLENEFGVPKGLRLLYAGRVSKEKNLTLLENAFKEVCSAKNDVQLIVVGDGPYWNEMRQNLEGFPAYFTGYLSGKKLLNTFASSDLFVFPSLTDTFGNVVLEAQASGLPVIVSDQGGPCENILKDKTGIVIKNPTPSEFSKAIVKLLAEPEMLTKMGTTARNYAETRSMSEALNQIWKMYEEIHDQQERKRVGRTDESFRNKNAANF